MIIAIDGPAAAGKGTLARLIAAEFDYAYLDTGALYRAVGLAMLKAGMNPADSDQAAAASEKLDLSLIDDPALRSEAVGSAASQVASVPTVRDNLLYFQRNFAVTPPNNKKGAVLDGRDIGTVVCPNAEVKLYVTASPEERARRRTSEIQMRGEVANYATILADVKARDARDMARTSAPLKPAADALLLDTTELDIDAVFLRAVRFIKSKA
ncbi:(d)CMP kinase [Kordiimonas pumila]|uniref:Cytidylate kinase n=1 Tax=Kordiimonas pumila TaxID=2161677 RepID=A0ABV7D674_9PROT|nr:(d)CMP kinase [Kordiimonas pumila]